MTEPTVADFAEEYLTLGARLKPSTLRDYRYALRSHVLPRLGDRPLASITTGDVLRLHHALAATPTRANRATNILCGMLRVARQLGYDAQAVERPKPFRDRRCDRYLTRDEAARLLHAIDREPSIAGSVIHLLLLTGMRKSELFSLRWDNVDLERRVLRLSDSKTGQRTVPLNGPAIQVLLGLPRGVGTFVFPSRSRAGHTQNCQRVWERLRREAGLERFRMHDLRHSWASFAVVSGVPLAVVGAALGHSNPSTTQRYAHVAPAATLDAANRVALALSPGTAGKAG